MDVMAKKKRKEPVAPEFMKKAQIALKEILPAGAEWCLLVQPDTDGDVELNMLTTVESTQDLAASLRRIATKLGGDA